MTEATKTNVIKHNAGDQIKVTADISNGASGYTITVPHLTTIEDWTFASTTEDDFGGSVSGNVITIASTAALAGKIAVYGR